MNTTLGVTIVEEMVTPHLIVMLGKLLFLKCNDVDIQTFKLCY